MKSAGLVYVGVAVVVCLAATGSVWGVQYTITDLGTLGGNVSGATAVSNAGQVTGMSAYPGSVYHAFLYDGTAMRDLGTLGGTDTKGFAINDSGQVAGESDTASGAPHAFLYEGSTMKDLGQDGYLSCASGINNDGVVVGTSSERAFKYSNGSMQYLGTLANYGRSYAYAINDSSQITGQSSAGFGLGEHAFLYDATGMHDLGTLGGNVSIGRAINDQGQVAGESYTADGFLHAFLYNGTSMLDLGTLGGTDSRAYGINNSGQVVGDSYYTAGMPFTHAFLYEEGVMMDLNTLLSPNSGWNLWTASDINDHGQIVGVGSIGGQSHAFLMTPIPEPATLLLLGLGGMAVAAKRCRSVT